LPLQSLGDIIYITMTGLTTYEEIGGSTVDSYRLERSFGSSGIWEIIQGDPVPSLNLEISISGHTLGETYHFRASAGNIHSWGAYSDILTVVATTVPEKPDPTVITIENTDFKISWTPPDDNYGAITKYIITIRQAEGAYSEELTYCDGTDTTIVAQAFCIVPGSVLRAAPYSLTFDTLVQAKLIACNLNGCGD
jgi:hypothetical protein